MGRYQSASSRIAQRGGANPNKQGIAAFHPSVTGGNRSSSATGRLFQSGASKIKKGVTKVGNSIAKTVTKHAETLNSFGKNFGTEGQKSLKKQISRMPSQIKGSIERTATKHAGTLNNIGKSFGSEAQKSLKQQFKSMPSQIKGSFARTGDALKSKAYAKLDDAARHVVTVNHNNNVRNAYKNPQRAQPIMDQNPYPNHSNEPPMAQVHSVGPPSGTAPSGKGKRKATSTATSAAAPAKKAHLPTSRPSNPHVSAGALQQAKSKLRQTSTKKSAAQARAVGRQLNNQVRRKRIAAAGGSHNRKRLGATKLGKMD